MSRYIHMTLTFMSGGWRRWWWSDRREVTTVGDFVTTFLSGKLLEIPEEEPQHFTEQPDKDTEQKDTKKW